MHIFGINELSLDLFAGNTFNRVWWDSTFRGLTAKSARSEEGCVLPGKLIVPLASWTNGFRHIHKLAIVDGHRSALLSLSEFPSLWQFSETPLELVLELLLELVVTKEVDEWIEARIAHGQPMRTKPNNIDIFKLVNSWSNNGQNWVGLKWKPTNCEETHHKH